jgi:hypothetical protein
MSHTGRDMILAIAPPALEVPAACTTVAARACSREAPAAALPVRSGAAGAAGRGGGSGRVDGGGEDGSVALAIGSRLSSLLGAAGEPPTGPEGENDAG